eukprot:494467-Hanusia_phi.AAC.1
MTALSELDLRGNKLTVISAATFTGLTNDIFTLDISNNDIFCIDPHAFDACSSTSHISITYNSASLCWHTSWPVTVVKDAGLQQCTDETTPCVSVETSPSSLSNCSAAGDTQLCSCPPGFFPRLSPLGHYACQQCSPGSFKPASGALNCSACSSLSACGVGQYWRTCSSTADGACADCTNKMPGETVYVGPGDPDYGDSCAWTWIRAEDGRGMLGVLREGMRQREERSENMDTCASRGRFVYDLTVPCFLSPPAHSFSGSGASPIPDELLLPRRQLRSLEQDFADSRKHALPWRGPHGTRKKRSGQVLRRGPQGPSVLDKI